MWKSICAVFWISAIWTAAATETLIPIGAKTVLVYRNEVADGSHQFVLRIARFQPDIFLEWESRDHQGTVHLFRKAVAEADGFTLGALFDVGVDSEGEDVMTKWLSRRLYQRLAAGEVVRVRLNRIDARFQQAGRTTRTLRLNKQEIEVPGLELQDSRGGSWVVLMDPENPLVLEYSSKHYREVLASVSTDPDNYLRWIKQLPPIR